MLRVSPTQAVFYGTNLYWNDNGNKQRQEFATEEEANEFAEILAEEMKNEIRSRMQEL